MDIEAFFQMQRTLAAAKGWEKDRTPEGAPFSLLWGIGELGEVIDILKKKGGGAIMDNPSVRSHFTEECADVLMYLFDMMIGYGITAEELTEAYTAKFRRNMGRDWRENRMLYEAAPWDVVLFDGEAPEREVELLAKTGVRLAGVGKAAENDKIERLPGTLEEVLGGLGDRRVLVCSPSEEHRRVAESLGFSSAKPGELPCEGTCERPCESPGKGPNGLEL